ncbi:hypothetical protein RHSP_43055 [Rhizobium freirei PRF 81]|uniref:Uncharacterized protein n=1 Tax=Rhizobium freirei PRF 81 TaxID=363754 RepID=N6VCG0_9HYPH|nr:hypothetical protein RHSP_43055 [Rhizobium freirei PRF 81]
MQRFPKAHDFVADRQGFVGDRQRGANIELFEIGLGRTPVELGNRSDGLFEKLLVVRGQPFAGRAAIPHQPAGWGNTRFTGHVDMDAIGRQYSDPALAARIALQQNVIMEIAVGSGDEGDIAISHHRRKRIGLQPEAVGGCVRLHGIADLDCFYALQIDLFEKGIYQRLVGATDARLHAFRGKFEFCFPAALSIVKGPRLEILAGLGLRDEARKRALETSFENHGHDVLPCRSACWVEAVAQPVAQEIEAEYGEQDGKAREEADPPGRLQIGASIGQHAAPARDRGIDAEPEEGEAAFEKDIVGDVQRHQHDYRSQKVRQQMLEDDAPVFHADGARREDEFPFAQGQHRSADKAGILHPLRHDQQDDGVGEAAADDGNEGDGQQNEGHGKLDIGKAHQDHVPDAAIVARCQTHQHAKNDATDDGGKADQQRYSAAGDDAGKNITPERIRSERMSEAGKGSCKPGHQIDLFRAAWKDDVREHGCKADDDGQQRSEDEFEAVEARTA